MCFISSIGQPRHLRQVVIGAVFLILLGMEGPQQLPGRLMSPFNAAAAKNGQDIWAKAIGLPREFRNKNGMDFVLIPPGEFVMGNSCSKEREVHLFWKKYSFPLNPQSFNREYPRHRVQITKPFYMSACDVTVDQFRQFVKSTGYRTDAEKDGKGGWGDENKKSMQDPKYSWRRVGFEQTANSPVVNVTWNDAVAFCEWLSRREKMKYRLPTEAEWEYACRAGTDTRYWCGDDPELLAFVANVADAAWATAFPDWKQSRTAIHAFDGYIFTSPVAAFPPNPFGLHDMHGNVLQWCADWYSKDYYGKSPGVDPQGPAVGTSRVLRGGSWMDGASIVRSSARQEDAPEFRNNATGFRVVRTDLKPTGLKIKSSRNNDPDEGCGEEERGRLPPSNGECKD